MNDFQIFQNEIPWFIKKNDDVKIIQEHAKYCNVLKLSNDFQKLFPTLTTLLNKSRVSEVLINNVLYHLYVWQGDNEVKGWFCPAPQASVDDRLHSTHKKLLECFGGIKEHFGVCESFLDNLNYAYCQEDCLTNNISDWEEYYSSMCEDDGLKPYIKLENYVPFACEANGNCSLYHKGSGEVILFAHDHCFDYVTVLEECPEYTFYKINGCNDIREWIEIVAKSWLNCI